MENKVRTEAFASARVVCLSASLNRPLVADKVRDHGRHRRVEADHVHHAAVVRVGEGEAVGGHAHNDRLRVTDELAAKINRASDRVRTQESNLQLRLKRPDSTIE